MNLFRPFPTAACILLLGTLFIAFPSRALSSDVPEIQQEYQVSRDTGLYKNLPVEQGGGVDLIGSVNPDDPSIDRSSLCEVDTVEVALDQHKMNSLFYSDTIFRLPTPIDIVHVNNIDHLLDLSVTGPNPTNKRTSHFSYDHIIAVADQDVQEDFFKQVPLAYASKTVFLLPHQGSAILSYRLSLQRTYIDYSKGYKEKKSKIVNMIVEVPVNIMSNCL